MYAAKQNQMSIKGDVKAYGAFTYDSLGKKLRFRSNESHPANTSLGLDLLMFFDEVTSLLLHQLRVTQCCFLCTLTSDSVHMSWQGVFYEIDSKNQSCEKKRLHCTVHPLDIPDDAKFYGTVNSGSASISEESLRAV